MTKELAIYIEIIARLINQRRADIEISPTTIALDAMRELDIGRAVESDNKSIWRLANLQLRQLARGLLKVNKDNAAALFRDEELPGLQWRYPRAFSDEDSEPRYVLRDHMSRADASWNIRRLHAEGQAKIGHGDTLFEWSRRQWPDFEVG